MAIDSILIWVGVSMIFVLLFAVQIILLIVVSKKTHAIIEFKASLKGTPISLFFHDNRYCEWKNTAPEAGMIEDKEYGSFIIDATYIDKHTKNVLMPFNSSYAMSINAKAAKMADDLSYSLREQIARQKLKTGIKHNKIAETKTFKSLRTSIDFSGIKHFVAPIIPHNIQSKISNTIAWRLRNFGRSNVQNITLIIISFLAAVILGGLVLKAVAL